MSIDVVVVGAEGVEVLDGAVQVEALAEGPQGPRGTDAAVGIAFSWSGPILAGEAPLYETAPSAGNFSASACGGGCDPNHTATAPAIFAITRNGTPVGTVTFSPATVAPAFAFSDPSRAAGDQIGAAPPASPDATLQGANFFLADE